MSDELNDIKGLDIYQDLETKTKTAADEAAQQRRWQHSMSISYRVGVMAASFVTATIIATKKGKSRQQQQQKPPPPPPPPAATPAAAVKEASHPTV